MTQQLHIFSPLGAGQHVFSGMFGTFTPVAEDSQMVDFHVDPSVSACSTSLNALSLRSGLRVRASEVVTVEGSTAVINAVKANLARGLETQWNTGYKQVLSMLSNNNPAENEENDTDRTSTRLVAIPGLGTINPTLLEQSVRVERDIADRGIDSLVNGIPDVAPYFVDVNYKGMWLGFDMHGTGRSNSAPAEVEVILDSPTLPIARWGQVRHEDYAATSTIDPNTEQQDGWKDVTVAIPVYLPTSTQAAAVQFVPAHSEPETVAVAPAQPSRFSFGARQSAPAAPIQTATVQNDARAQQVSDPASSPAEGARQVLELIAITPILKSMIIDRPAASFINYASQRDSTVQRMDEGADDDDDDYTRDRERG